MNKINLSKLFSRVKHGEPEPKGRSLKCVYISMLRDTVGRCLPGRHLTSHLLVRWMVASLLLVSGKASEPGLKTELWRVPNRFWGWTDLIDFDDPKDCWGGQTSGPRLSKCPINMPGSCCKLKIFKTSFFGVCDLVDILKEYTWHDFLHFNNRENNKTLFLSANKMLIIRNYKVNERNQLCGMNIFGNFNKFLYIFRHTNVRVIDIVPV